MGTFLKKMMMNCDEEVDESKIPLTFTAVEANSSVKLTKIGSPTVDGVQYRIGTSGGWSPYTIDTVITLANVGDCVQFQNTLETLGKGFNDYAKFVMTGKIAASGNCMAMLNFSKSVSAFAFYKLFNGSHALVSAPLLPATSLAERCYNQMFRECSSLISAPELPATILADYCYQYMFYRCTSLINAPILPATTLDNYCYQYMFYGCTSLTSAPELPATTLANYCYYYMFQGCSSLVNAPELPATVLADYCYQYMFNGCTKLNYIKVNFSSWVDNTTNNWVAGVSSTGVFNAPSDLPVIVGNSNVPTGWTVTNN